MFAMGHGPGGHWFWGGRHGRRLRRGMLKWMVLKLLAEGERHGYDFLRVFRERGWGAPGPGSIYPILMMLEAAGYVQSREENGKRIYVITEEGLRHLTEAPKMDEAGPSSDGEGPGELYEAMTKLAGAIAQLERNAKPETIERIVGTLKAARKEIYTLLANE